MPTNLPPDAAAAELRYKAARDNDERIRALEEYISLIPKHKGTDHLRADLRRRLSKLRETAESQGRKGGGHHSPYRIAREGAGQIVLIGPPNTGKSALVAELTNADPEVSPAPFSTWAPTPGMLPIDNIQVQLIDTPPINPDYVEPEFIDMLKRADLLVVVVDLYANAIEQIQQTADFLTRHRIVPLHRHATVEDDRRIHLVPVLVAANKCNDAEHDDDFAVLQELLGAEWPMVPVSAQTGRHVAAFRQAIYDQLGIMRVYARPPGRDPDFAAPFVLERGSTVEAFAAAVHHDFVEHLRTARVWGQGVYDGQMVGRDHVLHEGDLVELRL